MVVGWLATTPWLADHWPRVLAVVLFLFEHFVRNPAGISPDFSLPGDPVERRAADYISGMTDRYAIRLARDLGYEWADWPV